MRVILAAAAALLPLTSSTAAPTAREAPRATSADDKVCERADVHHADTPAKLVPKTLGELPPGDLLLAVHREVDGCVEPVIVRQDVGAGAGMPEPRAPKAAEPVSGQRLLRRL